MTILRRWMPLIHQIFRYGIVGLGQLCIDWLSFVALTQAQLPPGIANVLGRAIGALAGFWFNGKWTFSHGRDTAMSLDMRHFARYLVTWLLNTAASTCIVLFADHNHGLHSAWAAKPVGDALLALVGFIVSKHWIYRSHRVLDE